MSEVPKVDLVGSEFLWWDGSTKIMLLNQREFWISGSTVGLSRPSYWADLFVDVWTLVTQLLPQVALQNAHFHSSTKVCTCWTRLVEISSLRDVEICFQSCLYSSSSTPFSRCVPLSLDYVSVNGLMQFLYSKAFRDLRKNRMKGGERSIRVNL